MTEELARPKPGEKREQGELFTPETSSEDSQFLGFPSD
jgi:hypothetical protein